MSDALLDLAVLERKKFNYLNETLDLTRQLGEALDRGDQESVRMVVAMRQEPILKLEELQQAGALKRETLSPEDQERLAALAAGGDPQGAEEASFSNQAGSARRLLERVLELDQRLNRRLAGGDSFYAQDK